MRISFVALSTALARMSQATIVGLYVPETIKPGDTVDLKLQSAGFSQSVDDIAVAFGYMTKESVLPNIVGNPVKSFYLGPEESNLRWQNITKSITIPAGLEGGEYLIAASVFNLIGATRSPHLDYFSVYTTFGDTTSTNYKASSGLA